MSHDGELQGVGGWLAFFLVTLGIITPTVTLIGTAVTLGDPTIATAYGAIYSSLVAVEWGLVALLLILCWTACALFLFVRRPVTVWIGIGVLWFVALTSAIGEPLLVSAIAGIDVQLLFREMGAQLIRPFVYAGVWSAYLLKSERVRNTYSGLHRPEAAHDVFA
jgi:hypothetical protein